jgi:hypothetical protein
MLRLVDLDALNVRLSGERPKYVHPDWKRVGRNTLCECGSGKKWKKCCSLTKPQWVYSRYDLVELWDDNSSAEYIHLGG